MTGAAPLRLTVGIATLGRPDSLAETLRELARQTRPPDRIVVAHVTAADVAGVAECAAAPATFLRSPPGTSRQRNAIIDAVAGCDVLLFLDDDFLPAPDYIAATLAVFRNHPGVVMTTGRVLADGVRGPGISAAAARAILAAAGSAPPVPRRPGPAVMPTFNGYGCNMALRLDVARREGLRFDERLPLYGWYEDIDFSRRLARHGRVVAIAGAVGVHRGVKGGRTSGRRFGYSQVVNPLYLWRKGSYPFDRALRSAGRHCLINAARALRPEPWVDRRGRLAGNALAVLDLLRGRAAPERILDL